MSKRIHWVEYGPDVHYLTFGRSSPWLNRIWLRVPRFIATWFGQ